MAKEVAKTETKLPATDINRMMREDSGYGVSNRPEDNIVPQVKVLQPLSPEVMDGPDRVEGAKAGDFMLGDKLISGKRGIWFQPSFFDHKLFEFTPLEQGGGFVAEHPIPKDEVGKPLFDSTGQPAMPRGASKSGKFQYEVNGNSLIHYRQVPGHVWEDKKGLEYVIAFKGTGHTVAREWMSKAGRANRFPDGTQRALYAHVYKLTTQARRNSKGQWFQVEVGDPVCLDPDVSPEVSQVVDDPLTAYRMGQALNRAFSAGERTVAAPAEARESSQESDDVVPF